MRFLFLLCISSLLFSCIPISIAPNMGAGKVMKGRKFKRVLPRQYAFIFEDTKDADEFYHYINAKYQTSYDDVDGNTPFEIGNETYYLTFYEVERSTQTLNLIPIAVDGVLSADDGNTMLDSMYTSRKGTWYIAITVSNFNSEDALNPDYLGHGEIKQYLHALREEYLATTEYIEVYLKAK
ncbi:MAG: hypothetical protein AAFP76_01360 [Bacteroidota bacterium]